MRKLHKHVIAMLGCTLVAFSQDTLILRNKIQPGFFLTVTTSPPAQTYTYDYVIKNGRTAQQGIWIFWLITSRAVQITDLRGPTKWRSSQGMDENSLTVTWGSPADMDILPDSSLSGYHFKSDHLPGIVLYYAEGYAPPPEGEEDSIPGYHDLTPYGPGIVGKTVGPLLPPDPFMPLSFLDTLLSYTRQSAALGWLGRNRDDDCDDDERPDDGVVRNIQNRLQKARRELVRGDSVKARRELLKLVRKIDRLQRRGERVMTSEAYALLKYNTEYLIERLPERRRR